MYVYLWAVCESCVKSRAVRYGPSADGSWEDVDEVTAAQFSATDRRVTVIESDTVNVEFGVRFMDQDDSGGREYDDFRRTYYDDFIGIFRYRLNESNPQPRSWIETQKNRHKSGAIVEMKLNITIE